MTVPMPSVKQTAAAAAIMATVIGLAVPFVTPLEGVITHPYYDSVHVRTWCVGETEGPFKAKYTVDECMELLNKRLPEYYIPMMKCINDRTDAPISWQVAMLTVTYNIGKAGFCKSSMAREAKAGNWFASCERLKGWWRAGQYPELLKRRREIERHKCEEDLNKAKDTAPLKPAVAARPKPVVHRPVVKPAPIKECAFFLMFCH